MHKCARCGKTVNSLEEVSNGCSCGSKIFVFDKEAISAQKELEWREVSPPWAGLPPEYAKNEGSSGKSQQAEADVSKAEGDGRPPPSYFARATFTSEDVENIKILGEGVFLLDIKAISNEPLVIKDEEEVYYIRLPFENNLRIVSPQSKDEGQKAKPGQ
ncbi:MAG: Zn-ribbon domain-containing protein [Candidatus Micrarchaeota archaeon]|nr:Zn-ribbon domain-containing protein [Candidatus Micrarchaeota archaeon]